MKADRKNNLTRLLRILLLNMMLLTGLFIYSGCGKRVIKEQDPPGRKSDLIMEGWRFTLDKVKNPVQADYDDSAWRVLNLPHTWNAEDGTDGGSDYYRGTGWYRKKITIPARASGKKIYLQFEGVNTKMEIFIDGAKIGEHKGGYTAFRFDITDIATPGQEQVIAISVDNSTDRAIAPLSGDFTFFGGIYRNVSLVYTDPVHIEMADNGTEGVYLTTGNISKKSADLNISTRIYNETDTVKDIAVRIALKHPDKFEQNEWEKAFISPLQFNPKDMCGGGLVEARDLTYTVNPGETVDISQDFKVNNPKLWNGREFPYRYQVNISVSMDNEIVDSVIEMIGFRFFKVDKDKGFYLNGKSYPLRGVAMHQDYGEKGNAVTQENTTESFSLMYEVGANAVRLSHYPHSAYTYELCDKYGIAVYAEIPFVNSYGGFGTYDKPDATLEEFIRVTKQQLTEMIKQQYNRSSICFWGLYNEAQKSSHEIMVPLVADLNNLAHALDKTRLTVTATFSEHGEVLQSDLLGWNTYPQAGGLKDRVDGFFNAMTDGRVSDNPDRYGEFYIEEYDNKGYYDGLLNRPVALSEYGIGGSIYQHEDDYINTSYALKFQSEEYQTYCHETWLNQIKDIDYLWGTFVWNMFDFSADNRDEATKPGVNTKGLVTRDRQTKKDVFYIYKATWSTEDVIYVTGKNNSIRYTNPQYFKVYSNCEAVTLYVDGKEIGTIKAEDTVYAHVFEWKWTERLDFGEHTIKAVGKNGHKKSFTDTITFEIRKNADTTVTSDKLIINQDNKNICLIASLTAENLSEYIKVNAGAGFKVLASDGKTPVVSGPITKGMKLLVTAEDGSTTALYTFVESTLYDRLVINVPSQESANPGLNLFDGNASTRWSGSIGKYPADIIIDLGEAAHISQLDIKWYEPRAYRYSVAVSNNGLKYDRIIDHTANSAKGLIKDMVDPVLARYIKISVSGTSDNSLWVSIYEVMMNCWWFHTDYKIDEEAKTITVKTDATTVISKEAFIDNLNLEGNVDAEVSSGDIATVYYITDGDTLKITAGNEIYAYKIILINN